MAAKKWHKLSPCCHLVVIWVILSPKYGSLQNSPCLCSLGSSSRAVLPMTGLHFFPTFNWAKMSLWRKHDLVLWRQILRILYNVPLNALKWAYLLWNIFSPAWVPANESIISMEDSRVLTHATQISILYCSPVIQGLFYDSLCSLSKFFSVWKGC